MFSETHSSTKAIARSLIDNSLGVSLRNYIARGREECNTTKVQNERPQSSPTIERVFGGGGLIAGCCSALAVSEQGRISVSGPEVIETNRGVEEFDSRDRALVWRTMGGKHRRLLGGAEAFVDDTIQSFRNITLHLIGS